MPPANLSKYTRKQLEQYVQELLVERDRVVSDRWIIDDADLSAMTALSEAQERSDGYWRLGRASDGNYWARYKWTKGPYAGSYCIGGHNTTAGAILSCQEHMDACNAGKRSPLLDKGYKNKHV